MITDGAGRAISFALAPGQAHELPLAADLVDCLPDVPGWVVGDKGYASHAFRQFIWDQGARPAIPTKSNEAPVACPSWIYNNRNRVERLWARLKEWRAVATRYETDGAEGPHARQILHGRALPCRHLRLDQERLQAITGPSVNEPWPTLLTNVGSPWLYWRLTPDAARPSQPARPLGAVQKAARRPCRVANTQLMGLRFAWPCCV